MINKIFILTLFLLSNQIFSQEYQGRIVYKNSCEKTDKVNALDMDKFLSFYGDTTTFIIKKGSYKQITNGSYKPYQLYNSSQPKLYYKERMESDTLYFIDYRKHSDYKHEYKVDKNTDTILGYVCHKLTVTYKKNGSIGHYYFAPALKRNPKYYKDYRHDNMNMITDYTKSIILKEEYFGGGMKIIREAIKVEKLKINDQEFEIEKDKIIIDKSQ